MEPADTQLATTALTSSSCPTTAVGGGGGGLGAGTSGGHAGGGGAQHATRLSPTDAGLSPGEQTGSGVTSKEEDDSSNAASSDCKSPGQRYVNSLFNV